ncbi:MAG: tetratricopeptide repeat protein [Elainella sp. Prado103]|jgi:tetratricopeptide (TPR) repeat protein|nr:tetratricopeptide repeat protein [Elainella sp. Prado103]
MPSPTLVQAKTYLEQGNTFADQGAIEQAIQSYQMAIQTKPDFVPALKRLIQLYSTQNNWSALIPVCQQLIALKPELPIAHLQLARALKHQSDEESALASYQAALERKSDWSPQVYREMGNAFSQKAVYAQQAVTAYRRACELKSDWENPDFYAKFADALCKVQEFDQAIDFYHRALQIKPDVWQSEFGLGRAYHDKGWFNEATEHYDRAIQLTSNRPVPRLHKSMGDALVSKGLVEEALSYYRQVLDMDSPAKLYRAIGDRLSECQRESEAQAFYQKVTR